MNRGRAAALSRRQILYAALDIVDTQGAAALSMRSLGRALGVEAMSLYHHVANREDLLDGLAEAMVADGLPVAPTSQPWDEALRDFATGIRQTGLTHPAAFQLVGLRPLRSDNALAGVVALLQRLHDAGFTAEDAVAIYRLAAAYARGFALAEIAGLTLAASTNAPPDTAAPSPLAPFGAALSADPSATFAAGLDIMVAGARQRIARPRRRGRPTTR